MPKIAIVAALEREVRPLIQHWRWSEAEYGGRRFRFFESEDRVLVCGGIGSEAARRAAEAVLSVYQPAVIYSVGFAGALDPRVKIGDLVIPGLVINASDGSRAPISQGQGTLVSFLSVASAEQKKKLHESFSAQAVDMEAAAVARAAEAHGAAFGAVKAISDEVGFDLPATDRFVDSQGQFREGRFALYAALRPWTWPQVLRLARNSKRASAALCTYLRDLKPSPTMPAQPPASIGKDVVPP